MFVLKSHHAPELSGPNCHAKLSHFETVAEKYSSSDVSTVFCSLTKKNTFTLLAPKTPKNHQQCTTTATKKKDVTTKCLCIRSTFRNQSASYKWLRKHQFSTCQVEVIEGCLRNVMLLTVPARHMLDRKQVLHLSAGQCSAHMALDTMNFLTYNFTRY